MNKYMNFSAITKEALPTEEKFMSFSKLMVDTAKGINFGVTKEEANEKIREVFRSIIGVDEKASQKELRRAIKRHQDEIFEVMEDLMDNLLTSGWTDKEFFHDFVETRNLADGDTNEFITEDETVFTVSKISGNHHDIERQRLGFGKSIRVATYWVGLKFYAEFEAMMAGKVDWAKMTTKLYEALDEYVNKNLYESVIGIEAVGAGNTQFNKTGALSSSTKDTFVTLIEDVQAANRGNEVVIMGTKSALAKISAMADVNYISDEDKADRRNLGRVAIFEGVRLVELPQVFEKGTTTRLMDSSKLLIMPVADNKFVKLIYEGNSQIEQVNDGDSKQDKTYEYEYQTKLGIATVLGRYFGVWKITA